MTKSTTVLAGLVVLASVATAAAQDLIPVQSIKYIGRYDLATGTFFPSDTDPSSGVSDSNPTTLYDNTATNGFLSTGSGAIATNHHMDWGTFATTGGLGASITEVRLGWATNLTTGVLNLRFRMYQGATGLGNKGTVVADYIVGPLPTSVSGGYEGYTLDVTLPTALNLADGPIGWSYNADNPVGAATNSSGPLLVGPPNGPGAGAAHGPPAGSYDRYNEATEAYVTTVVGSTTMLSFLVRLTGRANGGGTGPWVNYGTKKKVTLTGTGSATPGSVDNVITIANGTPGKPVILVAGLVQSDIFSAHLNLQLYAFPWIIQLAPIPTPIIDGTVNLPTPLDASLTTGTQIFLQAFGQNLSDEYKNYSAGLQLTIQ